MKKGSYLLSFGYKNKTCKGLDLTRTKSFCCGLSSLIDDCSLAIMVLAKADFVNLYFYPNMEVILWRPTDKPNYVYNI